MKIEEGDLVEVVVNKAYSIIGRVIYTPVATGDCWHIVRQCAESEYGSLFYVQNFLFIKKLGDKCRN